VFSPSDEAGTTRTVLPLLLLGLGTLLLGIVLLRRTAGAFIVTLPTAQAECDYVQAVVAQLHTELHQADRLTRRSAIALAHSGGRQPEELRILLGQLDSLEAAIDQSEEALEAALEAMRAKHGTPPACLRQIAFNP
jgi:hypothetical protein